VSTGGGGPAVMVYASANYTLNGVTTYTPNTISWDTSSGALWSAGAPTHFLATSAGRWTLKCQWYESAAVSSAAFPLMVNNVTQTIALGGSNVYLVPGTWIRASNSDQNISLTLDFTANLAINDFLVIQFASSASAVFDGGVLNNRCIWYKEAY